MSALAIVPLPGKTSEPLYVIEEHLAAMVETAELVPEEQQREFEAEFAAALRAAVEKRDSVARFMTHLEQQINGAKEETDRLRARRDMYARALERLKEYVKKTIFSLGKTDDDNWRKLEGKTTTFSLCRSPASVVITAEDVVPQEYKSVTVTLPAPMWERILDALDIDQHAETIGAAKVERSINKRAINAAISAGAEVQGATLDDSQYWLKRT